MPVSPPTPIAVAVVRWGDRFLIGPRAADATLAGKWEFPGGKVEPGETPEACLARELREELDIDVEVGEHVGDFQYDYAHLSLVLLVYRATIRSGELKALHHSVLRWVAPNELLDCDLADADVPIARAVVEG